MKLKPFVISERVIIGVKPGDQREVLSQLIQPLVDDGDVLSNPDEFLNGLIRRELELTTVMENGVAFPHARSTAVKRLCLTIGIASDAPIAFSPDTTQTSQLFFCIGVPSFAPTAHIPILQALANYVRSQSRVDRLLSCRIPSEVVKRLSTFKG